MGTQRVEAFLNCTHLDLSGEDYAFMMVLCQKWNDGQTRSLEIGAQYLISLLPLRNNKRVDRALSKQLHRLQEMQLIFVEDNGSRYLDKRWLRIDILDEQWWQYFEVQKEKAKKKRDLQQSRASQARPTATRPTGSNEGQHELQQSRAPQARPATTRPTGSNEKQRDVQQSRAPRARPAATRLSGSNSRPTGASPNGTRPTGSNSRPTGASTREHKEKKDNTPKKDQHKGRPSGLRGDFGVQAGDSGKRVNSQLHSSTPRSALVPADALADPETAEAVFNTMELPTQRRNADREAWQAVVDEMAMTMPAATYHAWLHGQTEFVGSTEDRFTVRTASEFVRDWLNSRAKKKMERALRKLAGRSVEIDFVTDSLTVEETRGNDSRDNPETLHEAQAEQADRPVMQPGGRS